MPSSKERLGYPTQKPLSLLEIIIKASSNEKDVILDPFCGCGTAIATAQKLNRYWIGIDVTHLAINLIKLRMKGMFGLEAKKGYKVVGEPEDMSGAKELALANRYQFQWWALSLIHAKPNNDKKKGADKGIDGFLYFHDGKNKVNKAIVQVKSGKVGVKDIRDLVGVLDREKVPIGIFITLNKPTREIKKEALAKGYFKSAILQRKFPGLQILTIEDLLEGKLPKLPSTIPIYKKVQEVLAEQNDLKLQE